MTPIKQVCLYSEDGIGNGDCFPACLASLLDIPLWMCPPFHLMYGRKDWDNRINEWLERFFKLNLHTIAPNQISKVPDFPEYFIAAGYSPRNIFHAVIYNANGLAHDPHPLGGGIDKPQYYQYLSPELDAL